MKLKLMHPEQYFQSCMHIVQSLMLASHAIKSCLLLFFLTCHLKAVKNVVGMVSAFHNCTQLT